MKQFSLNNNPSSELPFYSWKSSQLFQGLTDEQLKNLEGHLLHRSYNAGEVIIKEGTFGDAIFFIEKGAAAILKDGFKIAEAYSGEYFGAMALMENTSRSADVRATTSLQVKVLTINQLKAIESDLVFTQILKNHMIKQQILIRDKNKALILETKEKLEKAESKVERNQQYIYIIIIELIIILGLAGFIFLRN